MVADRGGVYDVLEPYPGQTSLDVTAGIKKKKLEPKAMVRLGESFFTSLGMPALPDTFFQRSLLRSRRIARSSVTRARGT